MSSDKGNVGIKLSREHFLWWIGSLTVVIVGMIEPARYMQLSWSALTWLAFGLLALIGSPSTVFLIIANFFYFRYYNSKGRKLGVAVFILVLAVSLSALTFYQAIATSGKGIAQYLAIFFFVFSIQVIYGKWSSEPISSRASFTTSLAASFGLLLISSIVLFALFGMEATYRDPVPLGLLAGSGLFLILMEVLRLKYVARALIASLSSLALVLFLFFSFGFALSMGFNWGPDYSWSTLTSAATWTNLILAVVSLKLFQITYVALRGRKNKLGT